jgi:hypothetical protein
MGISPVENSDRHQRRPGTPDGHPFARAVKVGVQPQHGFAFRHRNIEGTRVQGMVVRRTEEYPVTVAPASR